MNKIKKLFTSLTFLILCIVIFGYYFLQTGKPVYSGKLNLSGIKNKVDVYFDNFGIPHIYATNEIDAYRALGYLQAQERLFQLEMIKRVMTGRLSEIFGKEYIELDYFFKSLNTSKTAEESSLAYLNDTIFPYQKATFAYIDGINQYIKSNQTPLEFKILNIPKETFSPKDIYLISGYMAFGFSFGFRVDPVLQEIFQKYGMEYINALVLTNQEDGYFLPKKNINSSSLSKLSSSIAKVTQQIPTGLWHGSNSWIISSELSESGKVLFANDPHIKHNQPSVWYESHLEYPGHRFYGNFLIGIPFGIIGHTNFNAWGMTIFPYDNVDFYIEQFNADETQYFYNNNWVDAKIRYDTIKIKGEKDSILKLTSTIHGPIIEMDGMSFTNNKKISVWWNYIKGLKRITKPLYDLQHISDFSETKKIATTVNALGLNIMYADSSQNIAWYVCGNLPIRPSNVNSKLFLNGTIKEDEPLGYFDFSDNPQCENPDWGYLYSANNQPDTFNGNWHNGYFYPGYRGERIQHLIESQENWNISKLKNIQLDDISISYPKDLKIILPLLETSQLSELHKAAFDSLALWNGNHNKKSVGATIFNKFYFKILEYVFLDELTQKQFDILFFAPVIKRSFPSILRDPNNPWWNNKNKPASREKILNKAFIESIEELQSQLGDQIQKWFWNKCLELEIEHPFGNKRGLKKLFNIGPYKLSGGNDVLNKQQFILNNTGYYKVSSGPSARILLDFSDIENSISILPSGQSGHPLSTHYNDQTQMYLNGKYRKQMMNKEEILSTYINKLVFLNEE